jgi:peptide methionine sulfoxide reductase msrA/msrB
MPRKAKKTDQEWKGILSADQYNVMRKGVTEKPFSGKYNDFWEKGIYACAGCGTPLFRSESKYDHGTGWPSFTAPKDEAKLAYKDDYSLLMKRIEVRCATCGAHLGHLFDDGPAPTYLHYCINSAALDFVPENASQASDGSGRPADQGKTKTSDSTAGALPEIETATFAAGCFWGVEYKLGKVPGVVSTVVGYTGGTTENPTYEDVCTGRTGYAEAVRVSFDPAKTSYGELVREYFNLHDPTQVNRQGPDLGTQYRSAIFYEDEGQRETARKIMDELGGSGKFAKPLATELVPASTFYRAEEYHQKYFEKNGIACA